MNLKIGILGVALVVTLGACKKKTDPFSDPNFRYTEYISPNDTLKLKSGATVVKFNNGQVVWMGDMVLTVEQLKRLDETGFIFEKKEGTSAHELDIHPVFYTPLNPNNTTTRAVSVHPAQNKLWAMVRYVYAPNLTQDRKNIILAAMRHWEEKTNVRFYNATGQPTRDQRWGFDYPYIKFVNGAANNSYVGRQNGEQIVNIASYQDIRRPIHEIGHALGLFHEQSAANRDNFINIHWDNIKPNMKHNMDKVGNNYYQIGYLDFNSIMMYPSSVSDPAFVIDASKPIMTRKDGTTWDEAHELSPIDCAWANTFYLPYIARTDTYRELAEVVYKRNNTIMTPKERAQLQAYLNNGNPIPPNGGRMDNDLGRFD